METPVEIENLASEKILSEQGQLGFILGYNECLKDNYDKKYTEEDMLKFANQYSSINILHLREHLKEFTIF